MSRRRWRDEVSELAEARSRGEIDDDRWFASIAAIFEAAYLAGDNPLAQSGFGGNEARWHAAAADRRGGRQERHVPRHRLRAGLPARIDRALGPAPRRPYGLELGPALAELALRAG